MVISVHTFVNYANNLYASKILSLKITTTQHLSTFTDIRKIIINEDLSKAHTDPSKSKSVISKIFSFYTFYQNLMHCSNASTTKAARKDIAAKI